MAKRVKILLADANDEISGNWQLSHHLSIYSMQEHDVVELDD